MISELDELSSKCENNMQVHLTKIKDVTFHSIEIRKRKSDDDKDRIIIFFNEHAREMITGETALNLAYDLCGKNVSY